jgi:hypothetical protein
MAPGVSKREQERRAWVARQEQFKDASEAYERDLAAARTVAEREAVQQSFAAYRRSHRQQDVQMGKRSPGTSIAMHQIMWARWVEVAVEHELTARKAFAAIVAQHGSDALMREFRASLVAVTSSAHTIEAVFGDIKYLIPEQARQASRQLFLWHALREAFGITDAARNQVLTELGWLFELRGQAAHPYTESEPPQRHPAGITTGAECSRFNAVTSRRAVDAAMKILDFAAAPPAPSGRWVERWVAERRPYQRHCHRVAASHSDDGTAANSLSAGQRASLRYRRRSSSASSLRRAI